MQVSTFYEKLNKVDGNTYVVEEEIHLTNGVYEAELQHDNINEATFAVFTGPKLTGTRLETYTLSTPSLAPWKRIVRVYADVPVAYISYETDGDTVEGDDINRVQAAVVETQKALNTEEARALSAEMELNGRIDTEVKRAEDAELTLRNDLTAEVTRAKAAEKTNADNLATESTRAKAAEKTLTNNLASEIARAKAAEKSIGDAVNAEKTRATAAEEAIRNTISINKPNWDDKYTRNEVDNKLSALETAIDWKEAVSTYADLATTYPHPDDGWTVNVKDTNYTYRWSGTAWIAISANAIPKATQSVDGLLSKEDKTRYDDAYSKRHTHTNKSTLDKLTETLLSNWTDAYNKRHEHANKTVLDKITQTLLDNWNAAYTHISNKSNPHGVTKSQVGLGSVPNVATNDQVPTFTQATTLDNLTSGEKLTVMLGKIAKAIEDFITHKADAVQHITATERTNWNDSNSKKHSHSNKTVIDKVTQAMLDKLSGIASGAEVNVQSDWSVTDTGSDAFIKNKPTSMPANGGNASTADKLKTARQINGVGFDGSQNITIPANPLITELKSGSLNDVKAYGQYFGTEGNTVTGKPTGVQHFGLQVYRAANGYITQEISFNNRRWLRTFNSSTWSGWVQYFSEENKPTWANVTGKPSTFAPSTHTHTKSQITDMPTKLSQFTNDSGYLTEADVDTSQNHTHANKTVLDDITRAMLEKLAGIAEGANKYVHPTTAGNKHIPSGGASGQVLRWSADGTAEWGADSNSDTKVTQTNTTGSADYRMVLSGNANDSTETNTARKSANFLANPATGELYAKGFRRTNITGQTLDINTLNLSSGAPCIMRYIEKTCGGAANITNIPAAGQPFLLDVELIRWASAADYITMQTFRSAANQTNEYVRFCKNGTWNDWTTRVFSDTKYSHPSSGVTAGTYRSVTVNAQGHVTAGTNPTTLVGYGITDAAAKNHNHDSTYLKKGAVTWNDLKGV